MDQAKLKTLTDSIDKAWGKGNFMSSKDKPLVVDANNVISSGSFGLDVALGTFGYVKGRIVELVGWESSGKCLGQNEYILTSKGYKTVKEIFNEQDLDTFCSTRTVSIKYPLINKNGEIEQTTHFTLNGRKKVRRIKTRSGFEHEVTYIHPLMVLSKNGLSIWKEAREIEKGDILIGRRNIEYFGSNDISIDEAYTLGLIIADGYLDKGGIQISNNDPDIKNFIETKICKILNKEPKKYSKKYTTERSGSYDYRFNNKIDVNVFYDKFGLKPCIAKEKDLSKFIMGLNKESMIHFLMGYLDSECDLDDKNLNVTSASKSLLYKIKLILTQFGIESTITYKKVKSYPDNDYWNLGIFGFNFFKFINEIGLKGSISKFRKTQMISALNTKFISDRVPYIEKLALDGYYSCDSRSESITEVIRTIERKKCNLSIDNLNLLINYIEKDPNSNKYLIDYFKWLKNCTFDEVIENTEGDEIPTFDFAMEKTHSFIANGCINHNTTVALHAIAETQKLGLAAAYIDAENSFDPTYAENLGVDITGDNPLYISQIDHAEMALDIVERVITSGLFGICVIDSVAALTPKAEIEGQMGDAVVGLQARLMNQAMRKLSGAIQKNNCVVIFINQFRQKIGVVFGSDVTTSGGNALKFYASVRLEVTKIGALKDGDNVYGNRTRVKVIKNKLAPPFKKAEFDLIFGQGVSKIGEIVDIAVEMNIIKKAGSWFSYGESRLGQGRDNIVTLLKDNPELIEEIEMKIKDNILGEEEK